MFVIRADQGGFGERLALLVVARADRDLALPVDEHAVAQAAAGAAPLGNLPGDGFVTVADHVGLVGNVRHHAARPRSNCCDAIGSVFQVMRSEAHTSETPVTNAHLVCRLLLEKINTLLPMLSDNPIL